MLSRELQRAALRLADQQTDRLADQPTVQVVVATVTEKAGTALTVRWRDKAVPASYLASYTPAVNDRVLCLLVDNQLIALGLVV